MNYLHKLFLVIVLIILSVYALAADNGYNILSSHKIGKPMTEREKAGQIHPTKLVISEYGYLYIFEEYKKYFKLIRSNIEFTHTNEISIPKDVNTGNYRLCPQLNNQIFIQAYMKNAQYVNIPTNYDEPVYFIKLYHINDKLELINDIKINRMGTILPFLNIDQNFYHMFGNTVHSIDNPKIINNYLLEINKDGKICNEIVMKNKSTDVLLSIPEINSFDIYNNKKFIFISNRDLLDVKLFNSSFRDLMKNHNTKISIYTLFPETKSLKKEYDITNRFLNKYKKNNPNFNLKNLLYVWEQYYNKKTGILAFMVSEYSGSSTCDNIINNHLVSFNFKKNELKVVKLGSEFFERSIFAGYVGDTFYVFDWKKSVLYGLKLQ